MYRTQGENLPDMSRASESVTRVDVRFSNELYAEIQQLAVKDGARTHHISQKVEVSPTIVKLVQLGLDALSGKLPDSNDDVSASLSDNIRDTLSDRESIISDIVTEISDRLMGMVDDRVASHHILGRGDVFGLVDIQLLKYGIVTGEQVAADIQHSIDSVSPVSGMIPDNTDAVPDITKDSTESLSVDLPDNLSVKDVMLSDSNKSVSDSLPDTENIPSDDSSNSEPVAEDGLSDEQIAKLLSVDVGTVRRWKKGERKPSKANANLFERWEIRADRWHQITTNKGDA